MLLVLTLIAAAPPSASKRPTTRTPDCTEGGCHAEETKFRFLHAPTAAGACDMCHVYADETKHTFTLKHQGTAMCDFCHIGKTDTAGLHVHEPVKTGECTGCHNPHGSEMRNLINGPNVAAMCVSCHEGVVKGKSHLHEPITEKGGADCLGCHRPHASILPKLMVEQGRKLCLRCHADVDTAKVHSQKVQNPNALPLQTGHLDVKRFEHEPFAGECTQCHDQHGSNTSHLLKQDVVGLCTSCHEDVAKSITASLSGGVAHSIVTADRACLHCHGAHFSAADHLLNDQPVKLCLDCHSKETVRSDGSKIPSMQSLSKTGQHRHGPLDEGHCKGCHNPHGSEHRALLTQPYTKEFYQAYDALAYALCFSCHKQELVTSKVTTSTTNFRNGEQNLHWVHVVGNESPAKAAAGDPSAGRTCRACHATHTAKNAQHLAESVPYGQWNVPITFKATENGGSCAAGCHRAKTYDRVNPVPSEPAAVSAR